MSNSVTMSNGLAIKLNKLTESYLSDLTDHLVTSLPDVPKEKIEEAVRSFTGSGGAAKTRVKTTIDHFPPPSKLTLMLNYGPASHALFGEETKALSEAGMFNRLNSDKRFMFFKQNLAFGPGWLIGDKSRLDAVETALEEESVDYDVVERSDYEKTVTPLSSTADPATTDHADDGRTNVVARNKAIVAKRAKSPSVSQSSPQSNGEDKNE